MKQRLQTMLTLSRREFIESAALMRRDVELALSLDVGKDERATVDAMLFEMVETLRLVSTLIQLPSLELLVSPPSHSAPRKALLAIGGVSYDAKVLGSAARTAELAPVAMEGGRPAQPFHELPWSATEVDRLGAKFAQTFGSASKLVLTEEKATKEALFENCKRASHIHFATHGYFAGTGVRSTRDADPDATGDSALASVVRGLAPDMLCGLALAGANQGIVNGSVPGILTAAELAALDLSNCQLAVLSGCDTNVGVARAGQGIHSLQAALHSAGARATITSLWSVPDEGAKTLMSNFYHFLWVDGVKPAEALWRAKRLLAAKGAPLRHWAGWVLTGLPGR